MTYAKETQVPVEKSRNEIEKTLARYGADRFAYFTESGRAIIIFEAKDRRLKFELPLPAAKPGETEKLRKTREQVVRSRWRALLLVIKAKLESVESKIETFEDAFLANILMPSGETVGEYAKPRVAALYKGEPMQALLPAPRGTQ